MKQLTQNLSRLQKVHNLSITELANTLDVSRRTVDRILGRDIDVRYGIGYTPTKGTLEKVADAFGVSMNDVTKRLPRFAIDSVQPQFGR